MKNHIQTFWAQYMVEVDSATGFNSVDYRTSRGYLA